MTPMKEFTIRLSDEVFEKLGMMQNKGSFVRKLIERELSSDSRQETASGQKGSFELKDDVRRLNDRIVAMEHKIDSIYSMLRSISHENNPAEGKISMGIEYREDNVPGKASGMNLEEVHNEDQKELEKSILIYIPHGSQTRRDVVANLLSRKYDLQDIEKIMDRMVVSGTILKVTKEGYEYLLRP